MSDSVGIELEETDLDKVDALWLHSPNCLRATMQERLSHRWLVCTLNPAWPQLKNIYKRHWQVRQVVPYSPK
jgi:hypothetical protein